MLHFFFLRSSRRHLLDMVAYNQGVRQSPAYVFFYPFFFISYHLVSVWPL